MRVDPSAPVLVVDDSITMGRIICTLLKQAGFRSVELVQSGAEALVQLRAKSYAIVISDWNMEPMSGYDLLKEIRSDNRLANVRFLMISAETSIDKVVAAKRARADSYLVKPFDAETLRKKIVEAFRSRDTMSQDLHQPA